MREMFTGIVEPWSFRVGPRKRRTPQITLVVVCCATLLLGWVEVVQLANADLPLTPRELIAFLPVRPIADVELPAPRRSTAAPITAPDGFAPERNDTDVSGPALSGVEMPGSRELPPDAFKREPLPPPAQAAATPEAGAIPRVGDTLRPPVRITNVNPVYPAVAIAARVEGVVIIEATINTDGKVVKARILRSIPLLDAAALEAVRQWEYTPSFLNGQRTPVIMTITINFTLQ
jgi:TonB family protein